MKLSVLPGLRASRLADQRGAVTKMEKNELLQWDKGTDFCVSNALSRQRSVSWHFFGWARRKPGHSAALQP